jgi:hypothetical protein
VPPAAVKLQVFGLSGQAGAGEAALDRAWLCPTGIAPSWPLRCAAAQGRTLAGCWPAGMFAAMSWVMPLWTCSSEIERPSGWTDGLRRLRMTARGSPAPAALSVRMRQREARRLSCRPAGGGTDRALRMGPYGNLCSNGWVADSWCSVCAHRWVDHHGGGPDWPWVSCGADVRCFCTRTVEDAHREMGGSPVLCVTCGRVPAEDTQCRACRAERQQRSRRRFEQWWAQVSRQARRRQSRRR